jgi:hypothetical protein
MEEATEIQVQSALDRARGFFLSWMENCVWANGSVTSCPFNNGEEEVNIL